MPNWGQLSSHITGQLRTAANAASSVGNSVLGALRTGRNALASNTAGWKSSGLGFVSQPRSASPVVPPVPLAQPGTVRPSPASKIAAATPEQRAAGGKVPTSTNSNVSAAKPTLTNAAGNTQPNFQYHESSVPKAVPSDYGNGQDPRIRAMMDQTIAQSSAATPAKKSTQAEHDRSETSRKIANEQSNINELMAAYHNKNAVIPDGIAKAVAAKKAKIAEMQKSIGMDSSAPPAITQIASGAWIPSANAQNDKGVPGGPAAGVAALRGQTPQQLAAAERQAAIERSAGIGTNVLNGSVSTPQNTSQGPVAAPATVPTAIPAIPTQGGAVSGVQGASTGHVDPLAAQRGSVADLRKQLAAAQTPSGDEAALNDQYAQLKGLLGEKTGALYGQGRGITLDILRGQQGKLEETANLKGQTILDRIAAAQADRQARATALAAQLGYATQDLATNAAQTAPMNVGGNVIRLNPATGQYETVYSSPAGQSEGFTLGAGQSRYDANGNLVASAPESQSSASQPATVQEYEYAKSQGYGGSFLDYQAAKQAATTQNPSDKAPSDIQRKSYGFYTRSQDAEKNVEAAMSDPNFGSLVIQQNIPHSLQSQAYQQYHQAAEAWIKAVLRQESGAAIPEAEIKSYMDTYFPVVGDSAATAYQKQQSRAAAMESLRQESANAAGGQQDDPLGLGFSGDPSRSVNGSAQAIASAIKRVESGGNYGAVGGSGEHGAYQFMPSTWQSWAGKYLGDAGAPMTPQNQDRVAEAHISDLMSQGYDARQIALLWNSGSTTPRSGVNKYGVRYDSGAYADKVLSAMG